MPVPSLGSSSQIDWRNMPYSPEEAREAVLNARFPKQDAFLLELEAAVLRAARSQVPILVTLPTGGLSDSALEMVIHEYEKRGWVGQICDRDMPSEYIELTTTSTYIDDSDVTPADRLKL